MNCERARDLILDSLMDVVDAAQRQALATHIETCASCAAEAKTMGLLWTDLGQLTVPLPSPRTAVAFGRRLAEAGRPRGARGTFRIAASVALLLAGAHLVEVDGTITRVGDVSYEIK